MARCLIGCGSNLGSRREQLDRAIELLRFMPGVTVQAVSAYRETRPIGGPPGQPPFLNGACLIETELDPHDVLGMLAAVENTLARDRQERWSARTIDLDLLLYDELVLETEALTVPHPRMATRRFVLEPSVEIAPDLPHPTAGCSLRDLLGTISAPCPLVSMVGVPGSGASEVATAVADATMARLIPAPRPAPLETDDVATWLDVVERWARATAPRQARRDEGADDCGVAITDHWIGTIGVAAEGLPAAERRRFDEGFAPLAAAAVVPHAIILLVVEADTLAERMTFQSRRAAQTDVFSDVGVMRGACVVPAAAVAPLVRLQERLACRLRNPGGRFAPAPRAVVTIGADDLSRATDEAIAAVEAML